MLCAKLEYFYCTMHEQQCGIAYSLNFVAKHKRQPFWPLF
jgi:hypothetical protein